MPPKAKDPESQAGSDINVLCVLMASATEFNPDYNVVAEALGISHAKNVPRKIDTVLKQAGYVLKNKKVVKIDGDSAVPTPKTPKVKEPKTPGATDDEDEKPKKSTKKTPKKEGSKSPVKKAAATPKSAKKRKIEEVKDEEDDMEVDEDKAEVEEEKNGDADTADEDKNEKDDD